jgi:hypothetical protein
MYQRSQVHGRRLCSGLTGVCLLLLFAASHAKAGPLPPPPPPPLAPLLLNGTLLFNLIPRVDFVDFGNYSLFQPGPTPNEDSIMLFRALGTPSPLLAGQIAAGPFQFGRAVATLTYELEILGPPGSVPMVIDVSGAVSGHLGPGNPGAALLLQSNWSIEDVVLGPVFSDAIDSGVQPDDFAQNFSHKVLVTVTANHIHRVMMFVDVEAGGGTFGAFATASIDPVFSFAPGVDPAYSFLFSDGIGNSSIPAISEPNSVVLLCTGAIAIGLLRRRSRLRRLATPGCLCGEVSSAAPVSAGPVFNCAPRLKPKRAPQRLVFQSVVR